MPLGLFSHSFVDPSISVKSKVTVPVGWSAISSEQSSFSGTPPYSIPNNMMHCANRRAARV